MQHKAHKLLEVNTTTPRRINKNMPPKKPLSVAVLMDPIDQINTLKDSSFAMMLEAQRREHTVLYFEQRHLYQLDSISRAKVRPVKLKDSTSDWFELGEFSDIALHDIDVVLMRKDPPFDLEYIYTTHLLEQAERQGTLVINRCAALRDHSEKLATALYPELCPPSLTSRAMQDFVGFLEKHQDIIIKPLDGMGGASIFRITANDPNKYVILETLTNHNSQYAIAQRFIPEITQGDKRILVIDGEAIPYALARIPKKGENRGNLAAGGSGVGVELSDNDFKIVETVAPLLRSQGIMFAGLDVIGDYLTEINITSPTCIRELDKLYDLNISAQLFDRIEQKLAV